MAISLGVVVLFEAAKEHIGSQRKCEVSQRIKKMASLRGGTTWQSPWVSYFKEETQWFAEKTRSCTEVFYYNLIILMF